MKISLLHIALFLCGLLLTNSPIAAQVLLPQYSMWEGFAFGNKQVVESREAEERFARFLLGMAHQTPTHRWSRLVRCLPKQSKTMLPRGFSHSQRNTSTTLTRPIATMNSICYFCNMLPRISLQITPPIHATRNITQWCRKIA